MLSMFEEAAELVAEGNVIYSCNALFMVGASSEIVNAYSKLMSGDKDPFHCWLQKLYVDGFHKGNMKVPEGVTLDEWFKDLRVLMLLFAGQYFLDEE